MTTERIWQLARRDFLKLSAGALAGGVLSYPTSEIARFTHTEIVREIRNKKPKILDVVPENSVTFGYWPDNNDYTLYKSHFGREGQIVGFFVEPEMDNPDINSQIAMAQKLGKDVAITIYIPIHHPNRFQKYKVFADKVKEVCTKPPIIRPNIEPNQRNNKHILDIRNGEDYINWWLEFHNYIMNENLDCQLMLCLNTTEEVFNTEPIEHYIPPVGVDMFAFDTFKRFNPYPHYKSILTNFSAFEHVAHDVAVVQELLPDTPWGFSEIGSETDLSFKPDLLHIAPYLGASFSMIFEWKKDHLGDPDEVDWRSVRNLAEHRNVIQAISTLAYIPD